MWECEKLLHVAAKATSPIHPSANVLPHLEPSTSLPDNNPCRLTYKSDNSLILGCFTREPRAITKDPI